MMANSLLDMVRYLENSLGYFQGIVRGMAIPFVVVDTREILQMTNGDFMTLLEHSGQPEELYGQKAGQLLYGDASRKTVLATTMERGQSIREEVEFVSRKGNVRNILIDAGPLYNAINGKLMGALCVYSDFTQLRYREAMMLAQTDRMRETAREAKGIADNLAEETEDLARQVDTVEHDNTKTPNANTLPNERDLK